MIVLRKFLSCQIKDEFHETIHILDQVNSILCTVIPYRYRCKWTNDQDNATW